MIQGFYWSKASESHPDRIYLNLYYKYYHRCTKTKNESHAGFQGSDLEPQVKSSISANLSRYLDARFVALGVQILSVYNFSLCYTFEKKSRITQVHKATQEYDIFNFQVENFQLQSQVLCKSLLLVTNQG